MEQPSIAGIVLMDNKSDFDPSGNGGDISDFDVVGDGFTNRNNIDRMLGGRSHEEILFHQIVAAGKDVYFCLSIDDMSLGLVSF